MRFCLVGFIAVLVWAFVPPDQVTANPEDGECRWRPWGSMWSHNNACVTTSGSIRRFDCPCGVIAHLMVSDGFELDISEEFDCGSQINEYYTVSCETTITLSNGEQITYQTTLAVFIIRGTCSQGCTANAQVSSGSAGGATGLSGN